VQGNPSIQESNHAQRGQVHPASLQQQHPRDERPAAAAPAPPTSSRGRAQGAEGEGEGSYTATRDYQKNIKDYLDKADVKSDAEASKPRSESEAREMEEAEREGKSHSKGER
jgi:hypothetical protein